MGVMFGWGMATPMGSFSGETVALTAATSQKSYFATRRLDDPTPNVEPAQALVASTPSSKLHKALLIMASRRVVGYVDWIGLEFSDSAILPPDSDCITG